MIKRPSITGLHKFTWLWYGLALCLLFLDQWTKSLASSQLEYGLALHINSFLNLTLLHNPGAAFSFLSDAGGWQHWLFGGIAFCVAVILVVWIARLRDGSLVLAAGLALILSGAVGNLIDRLRFGYVVDFIQLHYQQWYWPAFNVADFAITVGAALLIFDSFCHREGSRLKADDRPDVHGETSHSSALEPQGDDNGK